MKTLIIRFLTVFLILIIACGKVENKNSIIVIDSVDLLETSKEETLAKEIKELKDSTGSELVILLIDSLYGEKIEDYSIRKAYELQVGGPEFDNGILITVSLKDHEIRIEVGTGLENIIRDEVATAIIMEDMAVKFKEENYFVGLLLAVQHIKNGILSNRELIGTAPTAPPANMIREALVIDNYLVDMITDTSVQDVSGSLVLIVQPNEEQIDAMLKEYGEEGLSTILDDASFYQSSAASLIDSLGIKTVTAEKRFIRYRNVIREWNLDLQRENSPWLVIFFQVEKRPEIVPSIEVTEEKVKEYFELD